MTFAVRVSFRGYDCFRFGIWVLTCPCAHDDMCPTATAHCKSIVMIIMIITSTTSTLITTITKPSPSHTILDPTLQRQLLPTRVRRVQSVVRHVSRYGQAVHVHVNEGGGSGSQIERDGNSNVPPTPTAVAAVRATTTACGCCCCAHP